jgi:putative PIN family toxin of toxin-antitoxin system
MPIDVVIDTNVIFAALYSRTGPSFQLLQRVGKGDFDLHLSVALALEYEDVVKRDITQFQIDEQTIDDILDFLCLQAAHHDIFYLWRPFLTDAGDDLLVDLAVAARCSYLVTYNLKDFKGVEKPLEFSSSHRYNFLQ